MSLDVRLEFGIKQKMRDGVKLSSDLYRPDAKGKFPVILTRSPYMTVEGFQKRFSEEAKFFARHGYVFVIQDCRGKNDSEGTFHPFFDDPTDGFDTLNWCAKQEWSNGELGTIGASYQAWNQWAAATLNPPNLRAMVSIVALPDPVLNVPFQNGALVLWMAEWMAMVEGKKNTDPSIFDSLRLYNHLPLKTMDEVFGRKQSLTWQNWMRHPSADDYWKRSFYQDKFSQIDVPALHVSGWYDDDVIGTHINYTGMRKLAKSEQARNNQKLIIGPWPHHVNLTRQLGAIDFGQLALIDLRTIELEWFDCWLKGIDTGIMKRPKVDIFTMGENVWRRTDSWPFEETEYAKYFIHSNGMANTSTGDGEISATRANKEEPYDSFTYDPSDPCPNICDTSSMAAEGPFDQRPIERRNDVLVYSTPTLDAALNITGPVKVKLFASTSARDTDFWAQLVDVFPNGYSMHLTEGIIRARYRNSLEKQELLESERVYEFDIDLWVTSNVFQRGHRVRLDISSSSFPKYDRNPNTGNPFGMDTTLKVADQRVYHDERHPSHILLPVIK
ncbi:MAG: CocE/NonD family hydrolase [Candidatus Bathyarchaeia archaeon]